MYLKTGIFAVSVGMGFMSGSAFAQNLDLFGTQATTTMTNTATGLFSQQSVGVGAVSSTVNSAADAAGNVGLLTGGTTIVETYSDITTGNTYYESNNGGAVTLSNSATNVLNQFNADRGTMTDLLGTGITLANEQVAVAQQGLAEGDTTATMGLPDMATAGAVSNLTVTNSAIGAGNVISLPINPLE